MKRFKLAVILYAIALPSLAWADTDAHLQGNECDVNGVTLGSYPSCFQGGMATAAGADPVSGNPLTATITTAGPTPGSSVTQNFSGHYYYYLNSDPKDNGPYQGAKSNPGLADGALDIWNMCRYVDNYSNTATNGVNITNRSYFVPFRTGNVTADEWPVFYRYTAPHQYGPGIDAGGDWDTYTNVTPASGANFFAASMITHSCARPTSFSIDATGGNNCPPATYPVHLPYARTGSLVQYTYAVNNCSPTCITNATTQDTQCSAPWTESTTASYTALNSDVDNPSWETSVVHSSPPQPACNPNSGGPNGNGLMGPYWTQCQGACGTTGTQTYYYTDICGGTGPMSSPQPCNMPACPPPPPPEPPPPPPPPPPPGTGEGEGDGGGGTGAGDGNGGDGGTGAGDGWADFNGNGDGDGNGAGDGGGYVGDGGTSSGGAGDGGSVNSYGAYGDGGDGACYGRTIQCTEG